MAKSKNSDITCLFLNLVRAGLWDEEVQLSRYGEMDYSAIYKLAEEQSVVGLVTAGLENVKDVTVTKEVVLQFVGSTLQIEQRNKEVNGFVVKLTRRLKNEQVFSLLVKGQGVAQCYTKPLWRAAGDVDLLLDEDNCRKAKEVLFPIAYDIQPEDVKTKHQALKIMGVDVELHGKMPFGLSKRVDGEIDEVLDESLKGGGVSTWKVEGDDIYLPKPDNHIILVFTHFLHHFFIEGVGLRQICDWCRMLWTYRDSLNYGLLEERINRMGLMTEWRVFGSLAVDILGMLRDAMPFYDARYSTKAEKVLKRILKSGNFGHNNDLSYRSNYKGMAYKVVATWRRFWDFASLVPVFPLDAPRFFVGYLRNKV